MELTAEQIEIIRSTGNIKINAVAGSGKTTTVIEYAKARPKESKILYLAFNKSVKLEAAKKFSDKGLHNVKVETAHSLAYKHIVFKNYYKVKPNGYKTNEIAELLGLQGNGEKHGEYIIANHINKFISYFCNSDKIKVQDINYLNTIADDKARTFVSNFYDYIQTQSRLLLSKMDKAEIDITHDFYLKKFQLANPTLDFDYILFDEGQDASPAMLDIFMKQKATKLIVGDTHQQIYGWRHAVNSLEKANFKTLTLSTSFRFSQHIADLAIEVLKYKKHIGRENKITITGKGKTESKEPKTKAVLARTNLGLLLKTIEYITEKKKIKHIYFEGNINSYTYADDGASLYDVLNLYNRKHHLIKDKLIKAMKDFNELIEYAEKTEDPQIGMMIEIVQQYGDEIPNIIKKIKDKHIDSDEKEKAEVIFSTLHRCKGMEYDAIHIVDDFISEKKLEQLKDDAKKDEKNMAKLNEEINLLYVAITRAKHTIHIPENLMPKNFSASSQIHVIKNIVEEERYKTETQLRPNLPIKNFEKKQTKTEGKYLIEKIREKYKDAYKPWNDELDEELTEMFHRESSIRDIADHFGRAKGAIISRIKKLKLGNLDE